MLGKQCTVGVSIPCGTADPTHAYTYPINFGYVKYPCSSDGQTPAYILGIKHPVRNFSGRVIAVMTDKSSGAKTLLVAPKSKHYIVHEIKQQLSFLDAYADYSLKCLYERSCGAVVFHDDIGGNTRYLLIKNKRSANWSFPKGHVEYGESDEQAAMREVKEETGIDIEIVDGFKAKSEYSIGKKIEKTVYIYVATCQSTLTTIQEEEIEDYLWLDYKKAMKHLKFENDKNILYRVHDFLKKHGYLHENNNA